MKTLLLLTGTLACCVGSVSAVTTALSPSTLTQGGAAPGPTIDAAGVITLTTASNGQNNQIAYAVTDPGIQTSSNFSFLFNISNVNNPGGTADGFSFSYGNSAVFGTSGAVPTFVGEEPSVPGLLGFAFDTWNNPEDPGPEGSNLSQIALHYNGLIITAMDDTRLAQPTGLGFPIDDGISRLVEGTVNFAAGTVSLTVDGLPVFTNQVVPGLVPMESRIIFAARTGGENELAVIDALNVTFIPEPASGLLSLFGVLALMRRRRS